MTATVDGVIPSEVAEYLRLHHIITLSTASFTGMPHANTVAYANDDRFMYFTAPDAAQIVRNIADNHYVSFTIDDYTTDWRKVRELQGVGRCQAASVEEQAGSVASFTRKFGEKASLPTGQMFVIRPFEMHFVDYSYELDTAAQPSSEPAISSRSFRLEDAELPKSGAVATNLARRTVAAGEVIFRPGESAGRYFIVVAGEVELRGEGYGADQTVTRIAAGQLFGDQAALFGHRGALTAHAVADAEIIEVGREAIRDLLLEKPTKAKGTRKKRS